MAPWRKEKWPSDITVEFLWRDDELKPAKALSIYEELKAKGILVYRCPGSPVALALKDRLTQDGMGATSMATGSFLMTPPGTILHLLPHLYRCTRGRCRLVQERIGRNRESQGWPTSLPIIPWVSPSRIPEMEAYLKNDGYEFVGTQNVPLVPTSPHRPPSSCGSNRTR